MTIECKDLEWRKSGVAIGVHGWYCIEGVGDDYDAVYTVADGTMVYIGGGFDSVPSAQAAANEHNKQQFYKLIEQWRKG